MSGGGEEEERRGEKGRRFDPNLDTSCKEICPGSSSRFTARLSSYESGVHSCRSGKRVGVVRE